MKLSLSYSPKVDAINYIRFLTREPSLSYGRENVSQNILEQTPEKIKELFSGENTRKFSDSELQEKIIEILSQEYQREKDLYETKETKLLDLWEKTSFQAEAFLSNIFQRPFPFSSKTLVGNLTSLWVNPYNYSEFSVFISMKASPREQIRGIIHELNHFMFYYYYPELRDSLGFEKYELLKESLTFFTNPEWQGFPAEKSLRELYASKMRDRLKNAINEGSELLKISSE